MSPLHPDEVQHLIDDLRSRVGGLLVMFGNESDVGHLARLNQINLLNAAADELEHLARWKAESTEVLGAWEQVWEAAGRPGPLGGSKAEAVRALFVNAQQGQACPDSSIACPACGTWRTDPTAYCTSCGL